MVSLYGLSKLMAIIQHRPDDPGCGVHAGSNDLLYLQVYIAMNVPGSICYQWVAKLLSLGRNHLSNDQSPVNAISVKPTWD